ncbi:MAG: ankyrin repeat domain-containing protein [Candidatus Delongbacteria bacterium]|jgi:ankyrin repeat protein|nr:ankyrin repeat domain-containing protein [Candidatus Delongbacteria bacterium]
MFKLLGMILLISLPIVSLASVNDLKEAIDQDDLLKVKILLKTDKNLLEKNIDEYLTPLNYSASNSKTEIAKFLIDNGANINATDKEGSIPIHNSAAKGNYELTKYLIEKGTDINYKDLNGVTPLYFAFVSGNFQLIKYMIDKGADYTNFSSSGITPLHFATSNGNSQILKYLIKKGLDVNVKSAAGQTPIVWAVARNNVEAIKLLKENNADINYVDEHKQNLLFIAASRKAKESFELLLSYGLDINSKDKYNQTPLTNAVYSGKEMVEFLLEKGAEPAPIECMNGNICKIEGRTPLHNAISSNDVEVVKLLIKYKAPVNIQDEEGITPLILAIRNGSEEIVKVLLKNGADVNLKENVLGQTPLHIAASKGYQDIVELLLENGSEVNSGDNQGQNALYLATFHKNKNVVKSLLQKGADTKDLKSMNSYTDFRNGEAKIWFLGHSGWAIKTKDHLLVFDYWEDNRVTKPDEPNLNNGYLDPEQLKEENIIVFISHSHQDHYQASLFDWEKKYPNVKYVVGFDPKKEVKNLNIVEGRKNIKIDGVEIITVPSTDTGVAFLVKTNDLTIFHPGDHANMSRELNGPYVKEIDYLATLNNNVDISFFPVTGCNFQDKVSLKMGIKYTIDKFNPNTVFPMHCGNNEGKLKVFIDESKAEGIKANFKCATCKGDNFIYQNGDIVYKY